MPLQDNRETAEALLTVLHDLVQELHPGWPLSNLSLDSSLDKDLGLDSLGRVELMHRIERRFDVVPPERLFAEAETPRDLLRALLQADPTHSKNLDIIEIANWTVGEGQAAPHNATTLVATLNWHVTQHPDRIHIRFYSDHDEGHTISYLQLQTEAAKISAGLQVAGVRKGEAVAIMLPTGADYFFSFFGVLLAGGVPVPMYPPPRMSQLEDQLRRYVAILSNCAAPVMITVPEGKQHAQLLCSLVGSLSHVVSVEELANVGGNPTTTFINPNDIAFLQYTSGSTGTPKGVVLTHANLMANVRAMGLAVDVRPDDVFVSWLPLYHDMGLIGAWLGSLYHAIPLVVMLPLSFISKPQRWLNAIHRFRGTLSASPNFGYEICLRRLEASDTAELDLSCWRAAFNGAEAVVPETIERFIERFKPNGFKAESMLPVYGLAESSVGLGFPQLGRGPLIDRIQREPFSRYGTAMPASSEDSSVLRFVACGLPLPGHQIRVVDDSGRELPERRQGRIEFRGPSSTSGYFHNIEQTRALFNGDWLVTGDLGYISGGEIFVTGRKKDIIIRAGRNIYPQEVEQAVSDIEGIRKDCVAVFGGVNPATGTERLIVLAETRRLDAAQSEALKAQVNTAVTNLLGEPPDDIVLAPPGTVLKTSSGKVRRAAIREGYEQGSVGKTKRSKWLTLLDLTWQGVRTQWTRSWAKAGEWLFAGYAWSVFAFFAPIVWGAAVILPSRLARWRVMHTCIVGLQRATGTPLVISGLEKLPPDGQPFVIIANHSSYLDVYALTAALPRPLNFVAKVELAANPLLGYSLRRIGTEFVERFDAEKSVQDTKKLSGTLQQGVPLVFFPEGTFTRRPGLMSFHLGAFTAAVEADVPVLPIALCGTRSMLRGDSWFPRRGIISVTIGEPLSPALLRQENGGDAWKTAITLRDLAREHILRHVQEPDLDRP